MQWCRTSPLFSALERGEPAVTEVACLQARSLMEFSNKVIELGRQGVTDFRGRTNSIARAHNAQIAEEERAAREAARTAERCPERLHAALPVGAIHGAHELMCCSPITAVAALNQWQRV